jgi:hypothetical protein
MKKLLVPFVLAVCLVGGLFFGFEVVRGQADSGSGGDTVLNSETQGESQRQISAPIGLTAPEQPNIGFIDSPSATCYQPDPAKDECYVSWYYLSVDASPNYMITMTLSLNNKNVAHVQGFFQTSMYVPYSMLGDGFKVACGSKGAGGNIQLGNAYAYTVRARDSANLSSANYGTVYCPAYQP